MIDCLLRLVGTLGSLAELFSIDQMSWKKKIIFFLVALFFSTLTVLLNSEATLNEQAPFVVHNEGIVIKNNNGPIEFKGNYSIPTTDPHEQQLKDFLDNIPKEKSHHPLVRKIRREYFAKNYPLATKYMKEYEAGK